MGEGREGEEGIPLGQLIPEGLEGGGEGSLDRLEQGLERWDHILAVRKQLHHITGIVAYQLCIK